MEQQDAFLKVNEIAQKWGISTRRVRLLCSEGRIAGVVRKGNLYMIPANAAQPQDARTYIKSKGKKPYFPLLDHSITGIILNALKFIMKGIILLLFIMTDI